MPGSVGLGFSRRPMPGVSPAEGGEGQVEELRWAAEWVFPFELVPLLQHSI